MGWNNFQNNFGQVADLIRIVKADQKQRKNQKWESVLDRKKPVEQQPEEDVFAQEEENLTEEEGNLTEETDFQGATAGTNESARKSGAAGRGSTGLGVRVKNQNQNAYGTAASEACAMTAEELQKAVLWSEILGEPVSRRRRNRRVKGTYGN